MSITRWLGTLFHGILRPGLKLTEYTLFGTLPFFMQRRGFVINHANGDAVTVSGQGNLRRTSLGKSFLMEGILNRFFLFY